MTKMSTYFQYFCDLCVMEMVCFRLKSIFIKVKRLFAFLSNDIHFFVGTGRGGDCTLRVNLNKTGGSLYGEGWARAGGGLPSEQI